MLKRAFFLGSKKFGIECFKALKKSDYKVKWTIICPNDFKDMRSNFREFKTYTKKENIELFIINNSQELKNYINDQKPEFMFVCGFYNILHTNIIRKFKFGVWGIHNSLLPKYRGGSPLVWQIINNEKMLGSSLFQLGSGIDDGPIISQVKIKNSKSMKIGLATTKIQKMWVKKIPSLFKKLIKGKISPKIQNNIYATYFRQRNEYDGEIDWQETAGKIDCLIRAQSSPYPGAFLKIKGRKLKIKKYSVIKKRIFSLPGNIIERKMKYISIACAQNSAIRIYEVNYKGKLMSPIEAIRKKF